MHFRIQGLILHTLDIFCHSLSANFETVVRVVQIIRIPQSLQTTSLTAVMCYSAVASDQSLSCKCMYSLIQLSGTACQAVLHLTSKSTLLQSLVVFPFYFRLGRFFYLFIYLCSRDRLMYKATLMAASKDLQILPRLRPYPMRGHRPLCQAVMLLCACSHCNAATLLQ